MADESTGSGAGGGTGTSVARPGPGENPRLGLERGTGQGPGGDSPLQTDRGQTTIADSVVNKVAGIAAREVPGVHALGGGASRALSSMTSRVGIGDERSQGVSVEVGEREAAVDLSVVVDYGESIPQVTQAIRDNIVKRIEGVTGLSVTEVNITVNDLYFPGDEVEPPPEPPRVS